MRRFQRIAGLGIASLLAIALIVIALLDRSKVPESSSDLTVAAAPPAEEQATGPSKAAELERPEHLSSVHEAGTPPTVEDPRESARKKKLAALEKPWIVQKYHGATQELLVRALNEVESAFDSERGKAFDQRRKNGQYLEAMWKETGAVPRAEGIPTGEHLEITVVNPVEKFNPNRGYYDPVPVWYLVLTRDEYPAIFDLQDEVSWLRFRIKQGEKQ